MCIRDRVREALETASAEMKSFNEIVRSEIIKDASRKHVGKTYYLPLIHISYFIIFTAKVART